MNLFWKKLFGKIQGTASFEKNERILSEKYSRYSNILDSRELAEYKALFEIVKSVEFKEKKKIFLYRKYKDTQEYRATKRFKKLDSNKKIQLYFESLNNEELKEFLLFKESPSYELLGKKSEVANSKELQKFKKFEKSKLYKNYLVVNNSYLLESYKKDKKLISNPEFIKENNFWADKRRWYSTQEYETEQKFFKLADNPDILFYESINPRIFDNIHNLELTFKDEFNFNTQSAGSWDFGFRYKSYKLMGVHSFVNELQANTGGKNVEVENGSLKIYTKKEGVKSPAWDTQKGFVEKDFNFTSDVIHAKTFKQKEGLFQAKIRCSGNIHHAFWLGSEEMLPHINIFHFNGKNITLGNAAPEVFEEVVVKGICPSSFFVYSLEWTKKELIWYINNFEVFRTKNNVPEKELFMTFNSFIPQNQKGKTGCLEVDWIKVFKRKE